METEVLVRLWQGLYSDSGRAELVTGISGLYPKTKAPESVPGLCQLCLG